MVARGQLSSAHKMRLAARGKLLWPQAVLRFFAQPHKVSV